MSVYTPCSEIPHRTGLTVTTATDSTAIAPASRFTVLAPTSVGPLTIAPLVANAGPRLDYLGLASAIARGVLVHEVGAGGDVGSVAVQNPLDAPVLLFDGEEVAGAKQDRIINLSVLVAAASTLRVPVSCVEAGRWRRESPHFGVADHAPSPSVRAGKAEALRGSPQEHGRAQARVWDDVGAMSRRVGARSATGAHADAIAALRPRIDDLSGHFATVPGQCGALVGIGGRPVCLDAVSRAEVFAELWPRLLAGYAADALGAPTGPPLRRRDLVGLLRALGTVPLSRTPSVGLGSDVRGATRDLELTGLVHEGELIQMSAYARAD